MLRADRLMDVEPYRDREKYPQNTAGVLRAMTDLGIMAEEPLGKQEFAESFVEQAGRPIDLVQFLLELRRAHPRAPKRATAQLVRHIDAGCGVWRMVFNNLEAARDRESTTDEARTAEMERYRRDRQSNQLWAEQHRRGLAVERLVSDGWPLDRILGEADHDEAWLVQAAEEAKGERLDAIEAAVQRSCRGASVDRAVELRTMADSRALGATGTIDHALARVGLGKTPARWGKTVRGDEHARDILNNEPERDAEEAFRKGLPRDG